MRWLGAVVAMLGGCAIEHGLVECGDVLCPIGATCLSPGMCSTTLLPDGDDDGIADVNDNCPLLANPSQQDRDSDTVGDSCDNCVLISNVDQLENRDGDTMGDACDPNPFDAGDCLLLVDTFTDPAAFATNWTISPVGANVVVAPGAITMTAPAVDTSVGIELTGFTPGPHDLHLQTQFDTRLGGRLRLISSGGTFPIGGYACEVIGENVVARRSMANATDLSSPGGFTQDPDGTTVVLRLTAQINATDMHLRCRADIGFSIGLGGLITSKTDLSGPPGVQIRSTTTTVQVVGVSKLMPGTTCPATVFR